MVNTIAVDGYTLDRETLDLAYEEYQELKKSGEYKEDYKWKVLEEINQWTDNHEITPKTVEEFIDLMRDLPPAVGLLDIESELDDLKTYISSNRDQAAKALRLLLSGDESLEERIRTFRESYPLKTHVCGYLFASYDMQNHAPLYVGFFHEFVDCFSDQDIENFGSVPGTYAAYHRCLQSLASYLEEKQGEEVSALDAHDFMYCSVSNSYNNRKNIQLKYLFRFAGEMGEMEERPESIIDKLRNFPDALHEKNLEYYRDAEKVNRIRFRVSQALQNRKSINLETIKEDVRQDYDKNVLHSWTDFTILSQLYLNYYRKRIRTFLEDLSRDLVDEIGKEDLTKHIVDFQGAQNFPTSRAWFALFPASIDNHTEAYQLFVGFQPECVDFGIAAGSDTEDGAVEDRTEITTEQELTFDRVLHSFEELEDQFYRLNERVGSSGTDDTVEFDERFRDIKTQLERQSQVVFYGPPGTGKTYTATNFARWWVNEQNEHSDIDEQVRTVTFHPSFSYEDFIEGLTARANEEGDVVYEVKDGVFREICEDARTAYFNAESASDAPNYVLIIDEINRGNLPRIFGETITLLEDDKRLDASNQMTAELAHSGDRFTVPPNLKVIGTMNTADRSIALVDAAIRRRFRFLHFPPDYELLCDEYGFEGTSDLRSTVEQDTDEENALQALSILALRRINQSIIQAGNLGKGKQIGHSYFIGRKSATAIRDAWRFEILPLLEEYYFGQFERMKREVFDGVNVGLIDWDREEIQDFDAAELKEALRAVVQQEE